MSFTTSSPKRPCKMCGNETHKCRHHHIEGQGLCMTFSDIRKGEIISGYKCTGHTKCGQWARFAIDNTQQWTQDQRDEWERLKEQRRRDQEQAEAKRREESLSLQEKDKQYKELLETLPLSAEDKADLKQRGCSDLEIELCGIKSVESYQQLQKQFSHLLPGLSQNGKTLMTNGGYLLPVRNVDGLIVACQVRLRGISTEGRYRWLSSKTKDNPDGQSPHIHGKGFSELPLAVHRPQLKPQGIGLVEGTGVKPFKASLGLNLIVIGASGGQWTSSPNLLQKYLAKISKEVEGDKQVRLFIDAGDVQNKAVVERWRKTCNLLADLGYSPLISWWGQLSKEDNDVDELQNFDCIQYISPKEFFAIADSELAKLGKQKQQQEKAHASDEEWYRLNVARHKLLNITEVPYKVVNVPHMKEVLPSLIKPGTINIIIGDTGVGKTESVGSVVAQAESAYSWHNRVSLERAMGEDLGIASKNAANGLGKNTKKASFCSPSSPQFAPGVLQNQGVLLVDEADQVFNFNFGSLCNKDGARPSILSTLEAHIEASIYGKGIALFMSADITQKDIDYIKALAPEGTPVRLIINKYQPLRTSINLDITPNPFGQLNKLVEKLKSGVPCFALDDMKNGVKGCKSLAQYIRELMPEIADNILEIHADNNNDPRVKDFFLKPDKESNKYLLVICSPSVVSGISLKEQRFVNGVFGFCNGILMDREIKQFLNRVRGAKDIYLWIAEEGFAPKGIPKDAITPEQIREYYQRNYSQNSKHILSFKQDYNPMTYEWESPHFDLMCKNLADRAICARRLREFTIQHLTEIGYGIVEIDSSKTDTETAKKRLEQAWTNIEIGEAEAIAAARILSKAEMEALEYSKKGIPPELLPSWKKTRMLQIFGEELIEATKFHHKKAKKDFTSYAAMALKNSRGDYQKQLDNYWLTTQEVGEAIARDYAAEARQLKHGHGRFVGDIRWAGSARKCREFLGLPEFLKPDKWWQPNDYREMGEIAKKYVGRIKDVLGFNCENMSLGQIFGELMWQIGLPLETQAVKGEKWKLRRISQDDWNYCQMYVRHRESLKISEAAEAATAIEPAAELPQVDPIPVMLAEELAAVTTRQQCEELFGSVTGQQKHEAWSMLTQEQQQRIYKLFEVQVIQTTIFEQVNSQESIESIDSKTDIKPELASTKQAIAPAPTASELAAQQLKQVLTWEQVTQEMVDLGWWSLSEAERDRLTALYQQSQQSTTANKGTPSPGSKCKVWHYSQWLPSVINYWEHQPQQKFFKAIVNFVDGGSRMVWNRGEIQLFDEAITSQINIKEEMQIDLNKLILV